MTQLPDLTTLSEAEKDGLIVALVGRIDALTARVEVLEAENKDLREKLGPPSKTPDNSNTPPSRGHKANRAGGARPKAKPHAGSHRALHPNPTRRRDVLAEQCSHGQADVRGVVQTAVHVYDRIEIPEIQPDVTRVTLFGGRCPCCARRFKADAPAGLEPGSPFLFGANLRAFVLYLRFAQAIPFERLERLLRDLFGLEISEGALANLLQASAPAFERQAGAIRQHLLSGTILQSDETSVRVGSKTFWTWVFHHAESACFVIRPSRGKAVVAAFLGEVRPEVWVSDRLGAQSGWAAKEHQVCLAHLLRDIECAIDAGDGAFAPAVKALVKRAVRIGRRRPDLADTTLTTYHSRLQTRLDELLKIVPATQAGRKLQRIIKKVRQNLFVFITNREVPPTNLPAPVMVYYAIALALYMGSSTREVLRCLMEGLRWLWGAEAVRVAG